MASYVASKITLSITSVIFVLKFPQYFCELVHFCPNIFISHVCVNEIKVIVIVSEIESESRGGIESEKGMDEDISG